jgi:hypothetical protein
MNHRFLDDKRRINEAEDYLAVLMKRPFMFSSGVVFTERDRQGLWS